MDLLEVQKKFIDEIKYIDDTSQIILKGHLVAEDLMNQAIESFVLHGEYIEDARLQFHQKLEICRSLSVSEHNNNMWNVLKNINKVRNALAHSLDKERRRKAIISLTTIFKQEFPQEFKAIEGMSNESLLCMRAISCVLGFLQAFLAEVKRFEEFVKEADAAINKGGISSTKK